MVKCKLIVAGHSEGSTVAAEMANRYKKITHLIYAGGNPYGRILSIISQDRSYETDTTTFSRAEDDFKYWEDIVKNNCEMDCSQDTYKATFQFSFPQIEHIRTLKIPVLVCFGSKDWSAPYNDLMHVEFIKRKKTNVVFKSYSGCEHNFFPLKNGIPDYSINNWDKVAYDWVKWLN